MGRRAKPKPGFDRELLDLPAAMRRREFMMRVEAVIFAASQPVSRETLAALVALILHTNQIRLRSLLERLTTMSDVRAAQIVAIFGTLWMMLVWLQQLLNGTPLGGGSTAMVEIAFSQSVPSP